MVTNRQSQVSYQTFPSYYRMHNKHTAIIPRKMQRILMEFIGNPPKWLKEYIIFSDAGFLDTLRVAPVK